MIIKQLSVFLENRTGRLTELTGILAENDINISAFSIADTADYGILRMIVGRPDASADVLRKNGFAVRITDVVGMIVPHKPGGLHKALQIISDNGISIDYMYAFASGDCKATVVIRADSLDRIIKVLQEHKLELLQAGDVYQL
ncbi:MAG: ACT domain-containing protein [Chlorobium limicola]|uniref:ACT domain-containing protein n=1 Tax=Chlorobium limicola TaxID=1092 RepID=UPI0023F4F9AE|nr:ACT domain-containing protein [Chlorobium limicola]NTV21050.1 ACT domain-containing protein [Chlorobium limicola]